MSLFAKAQVATEFGRTEGRKVVVVFDNEADAIAAGLSEINSIMPDAVDAKIVFRTVVINSVETNSTKNPEYVQDYMIGRDIATNQTLRTWAVRKVDAKAPEVGDMGEFPAVHIPQNFFALDGKTAVKAIKPEGHYTNTSAKNAEVWNAKRQMGFAAQVASALTSIETRRPVEA